MRLLLILVLLATSCWAQSLEEGYRLLRTGDLKRSGKIFEQHSGKFAAIARARRLMIMGREARALAELQGEDSETLVTRLEILFEMRRFTDAKATLDILEKRRHRDFVAPFKFRFYLTRGAMEAVLRHPELAAKNYKAAFREAENSDQRLRVLVRQIEAAIRASDFDLAEKLLEGTDDEIRRSQDVWTLAEWLGIASSVHRLKGRLGSSAAYLESQRNLYLAHENKVLAARSYQDRYWALSVGKDEQQTLEQTEESLRLFLEVGDYVGTKERMMNLLRARVRFGATAEENLALIEQTVSSMPAGEHKALTIAVYKGVGGTLGLSGSEIESRLQDALIATPEGEARTYLTLRLAEHFVDEGRFEEAERLLQSALGVARNQVYRDRYSGNSRGPILARLARLERRRNNRELARKYYLESIDAQPEDGWQGWRRSVRSQLVGLSTELFDTELAVEQTRANLEELLNLPGPVRKAPEISGVLAVLFINQSIADEVLDPSLKALGDYPAFSKTVIEAVLSDRQMVRRILESYDGWYKVIRESKAVNALPFPLLYKGMMLEALGRLSEAESVLLSGLELADKHEVKTASMLGRLLLSRVRRRQGDLAQVSQLMSEAAAFAQALNPDAGRFYALVAGHWLRQNGQAEKAIEFFERALDYRPEKAWSAFYGKALAEESLGRAAAANKTLSLAEGQLAARKLEVPLALVKAERGRILVGLQKSDEARELYRSAYELISRSGTSKEFTQISLDCINLLLENEREEEAYQLSRQVLEALTRWSSLHLESSEELFEMAISLAIKEGDFEQAHSYLSLKQSSSQAASVKLGEVEHPDPEVQELVREVARLRERLAGLASQEQSPSKSKLMGQTRAQFLQELDQLKLREPDFQSLVPLSGAQLSVVQGLMDEDSVLVEYFASEHALYLFVVTSDGFRLAEVSVPRAQVESLVKKFTNLVSRSSSSEGEISAIAKRLNSILIEPIEEELKSRQKLRFVPSGFLWKLPFACLVTKNGRFLSETKQVSYLSSTDILRILNNREVPRRLDRVLLVKGADNLPGVKKELLAIQDLFPGASVFQAMEDAVKNLQSLSADYGVLHIASHSFAPAGKSPYVELGAERLKLEQVYGLQLRSGSLVVLSSCQSGVGVAGKEVTSLASAFGVAGASAVVASRWKVHDGATAKFFESFYRALRAGKSTGVALQTAENELRQDYPHPYFWSAFSLIGDPR